MHRPALVRDPRRHGRGRLLCLRHTRLRRAKVLDRADQEHLLVQRQGLAGQRPATTGQRREAFPARRIAPLDGRCRDHPVSLRPASQRLHACRGTIEPAAVGRAYPPPLVTLDHVGDQAMAPRPPPGPSPLARVSGGAPSLTHGADVGR
jgi:hypothetical protein